MVQVNSNKCVLIPEGSYIVNDEKNYTLGNTVCNFCRFNYKNCYPSSNLYYCEEDTNTANYIEYEGDNCIGFPVVKYYCIEWKFI